jgi:hypothetical protein
MPTLPNSLVLTASAVQGSYPTAHRALPATLPAAAALLIRQLDALLANPMPVSQRDLRALASATVAGGPTQIQRIALSVIAPVLLV